MSVWNTPVTWVNAAVTAASMNTEIRDKMNWLKGAFTQLNVTTDTAKAQITPALTGARAYRTANQNIGNGVSVEVLFTAERFDSNAFHDIGTNIGRLTIPAGMGGCYLVGGAVGWAGNATGYRRLRIQLNGTDHIVSQSSTPSSTEALLMSVCTVQYFDAFDYVQLMVFQNSGASLDLSVSGQDGAEFFIHRLSTI